MTRQRSFAMGVFVAALSVLAIGVLVRNFGAPPENLSGLSCLDPVRGGAITFCLQLDALPQSGAVTSAVGLLDQLPACGARTGMAPTFCVELATTAPSRSGAVTPSSGSAETGPCDSSRSDAPIFCLAGVVSGPESRQAAITYLADRGGLNTRPLDIAGVHLQLDRLIGSTDSERLRVALEADLAAVETYFDRRFLASPTIFVLATPSGYATALRELLGYTPANAAALAVQSGGLYVNDPSVIFVNWSYKGSGPLLVMRHELTHVMLREVVGREAAIPAWIDEGLATIVQDTARADSPAPETGPSIALALLAQGRVTLADLDPLSQWAARNSAIGGYAYEVSAKGVRELLRHVSLPVLLDILTKERSGKSFAEAYEALTRERYDTFLDAFARKAGACTPAIAIGQLGADGNLSYVASGFGPKQVVHMTIAGAAYHLGFDVETDKYGLYLGTFGSTATAQRYEIRASAGTASSPEVAMDTRTSLPRPAAGTDVCSN